MSVTVGPSEAGSSVLGEICSETGPLRAVLVHRPGAELDGLDEAGARAQLLDGTLWPEGARREHDELVATLGAHGVQVLLLHDLLAGVMALEAGRRRAVGEILSLADTGGPRASAQARVWLEQLDACALATLLIEGNRRLGLPPLANQMFVRDSSSWAGREVFLGVPGSPVRSREPLQLQLIYEFHPLFADAGPGVAPTALRGAAFEGGDMLVLSGRAVAIGIGERTSAQGARRLAQRLFAAGMEEVIAVELPRARFAIHLDCLLAVLDVDAVLLDRRLTELRAWHLRPVPGSGVSAGPVAELLPALARCLGVERLREIEVADASEQWRHATNTLALAPGTVVAYEHNRLTNRRLRAAGIDVIETPGRELGRGRGGPRCLSCPISRAA